MLTREDRHYWTALAHFLPFGPVRLQKLRNYFPTSTAIFQADRTDLLHSGVEPIIIDEFIAQREALGSRDYQTILERTHTTVTMIDDPSYPSLLKEIRNPPYLLFVRGMLPAPDALLIAIVGSRMMTPYGQRVTAQLAQECAALSLGVVSGLAFGIDAQAHRTTLEQNGYTLAVLASGVDRITPTSHTALAESMIQHRGAIVSEFPPGSNAYKQHFHQRNRLIAGLCKAVIVIEAGKESGSLITAQYALEQNREVFAVPGDITRETSSGANNLLRLGAHVITSMNDVCSVLNLSREVSTSLSIPEPANAIERTILDHLQGDPIHIDELIERTHEQPQEIGSALTIMEMKGMVVHCGGMRYCKK